MLLYIIYAVQLLTNLLLLIIGVYLLVTIIKEGTFETQHFLVLNLSAIEILFTLCMVVLISIYFFKPFPKTILFVEMIICCISPLFNLAVMYLSIDRFLFVKLGIRYIVYVNETTTKRLIFASWGSVFLISVVAFLIQLNLSVETIEQIKLYLFKYFFPSLEVITVMIICFCYIYIYQKFKKTRVGPNHENIEQQISSFAVFCRSKFIIPTLIIITYIMFVFIPTMVFSRGYESIDTKLRCAICYAIGDTTDVIIYIFFDTTARKTLLRKLSEIKHNIQQIFFEDE